MTSASNWNATRPPSSAVTAWAPLVVPHVRIDRSLGEVWVCDWLVDSIRPDRVPWRILNTLAETPFAPVDRTRLIVAIGTSQTQCDKDVARDGIRRLREQIPNGLVDPHKLISTKGDGRWALVATVLICGEAA